MRIFKKLTMTLALLLTAITGAWAEKTLNAVEFEVPAAWQGVNSNVAAADLPGFKASTLAEAQAWTGAPASGQAVLVYAFDGNEACFVQFSNRVPSEGRQSSWSKGFIFSLKSQIKFYYTTEITEWPLTSQDGKTWTLAKMPGSDIELQVEYFAESYLFLGKDALKDKANIAVKNGETAVTFDDAGKSATTVTEGNNVTTTYTGTKKVLGMKVVKKATGPVTYTELKGGEVLHVGDIITPTEELQINGEMYLNPSFNPYTVIRANIIGETSITVTPADDGAYYVLMYKPYSENEYLLAYKPLPVTNTSDGILVRYDGVSGNYKQYTFTVHEP